MPEARSAWLQPEQMGKTARDWADISKGASASKQQLLHNHALHLQLLQQHQHRLANGFLNGFPILPADFSSPGGHQHQRGRNAGRNDYHSNVMALQTAALLAQAQQVHNHLHRNNLGNGIQMRGERGATGSSALIKMFGGTPWRDPHRRYHTGILGLHEEIEDFYTWMSPNSAEKRMRQDLVDRISRVIKEKFPEATVDYFGSFRTGLFLPSSDIDMVLFGKWEDTLPLHALRQELIKADICTAEGVKVLDKASVPIIKMTDHRTDVKVDISINMTNAVNSAKLIEKYMSQYCCLPKLVLVLKQFLLQRDLNEVFTGGISSYSLILMTVSFLQLHPRYLQADRQPNLGVLLIEFFELYGRHFNYMETAIRVKNGGTYITKEEMEKTMPQGMTTALLSIEDPLQDGNDIGRSSYGALQVKHAFDYAYTQLSHAVFDDGGFVDGDSDGEAPPASILGRIIRITDDVVKYRQRVDKLFGEPGKPNASIHKSSYASIVMNASRGDNSHGSSSSCASSTASASSFDNRSISSRDSAASSMGGDSDTESDLAMGSSATVRVPRSARSPTPALAPPQDRPGSAPPVGIHRVSMRDACVQSDDLLEPEDDNLSESAGSVRSAPSEAPSSDRDDIKVVSYSKAPLALPPVPFTRSLDGGDRDRMDYRVAVLSSHSNHNLHPSSALFRSSPHPGGNTSGASQRPPSNQSNPSRNQTFYRNQNRRQWNNNYNDDYSDEWQQQQQHYSPRTSNNGHRGRSQANSRGANGSSSSGNYQATGRTPRYNNAYKS